MEVGAWEEEADRSGQHSRDLNFGGAGPPHCDDDADDSFRRRVSRDPLSHRIIEKRRRDRMNSCLADLSRLIPSEYLKRGRGRIEKTEIIEMAIRHMRHLQQQASSSTSSFPTPPPSSSSSSSCSSSPAASALPCTHQEALDMADEGGGGASAVHSKQEPLCSLPSEEFRLGYLECLTEALLFLEHVEGVPATGGLYMALDAHLRRRCSLLLQANTTESTKSECVLDEEDPFHLEMSQNKSLEHSSLDITASEGDEMEAAAMMQSNTGCQDCDAYQSSARQVLSGGEKEDVALPPDQPHHSYKFKSSIKRRFTAGLEKRRKEREEEEGEEERSTSQLAQDVAAVAPRIPVFALHADHSFYVPLMLDPETLAPYIPLLSKHSTSALHPVTISVNFCGDEPQTRDIAPMAESQQNYRHWRAAADCYISQ
ncbi:uncharacterized protein LOC124156852 isoform X2 [Ischnura elegans]|uniref:uncharacterized protein LOC124156852 isoform X2 n=1 Tax=Ischnura elegans TaxID=197161 RepID=UPI001ED8AB16|nr:uncharacterized protein LOC124156852 isoform X2 [Ischnura elegans]